MNRNSPFIYTGSIGRMSSDKFNSRSYRIVALACGDSAKISGFNYIKACDSTNDTSTLYNVAKVGSGGKLIGFQNVTHNIRGNKNVSLSVIGYACISHLNTHINDFGIYVGLSQCSSISQNSTAGNKLLCTVSIKHKSHAITSFVKSISYKTIGNSRSIETVNDFIDRLILKLGNGNPLTCALCQSHAIRLIIINNSSRATLANFNAARCGVAFVSVIKHYAIFKL